MLTKMGVVYKTKSMQVLYMCIIIYFTIIITHALTYVYANREIIVTPPNEAVVFPKKNILQFKETFTLEYDERERLYNYQYPDYLLTKKKEFLDRFMRHVGESTVYVKEDVEHNRINLTYETLLYTMWDKIL